jgi:Concanavalin A-like lectin/glucanases superfamily
MGRRRHVLRAATVVGALAATGLIAPAPPTGAQVLAPRPALASPKASPEAEAAARAKATGTRVEVGAFTSETRRVWANPDSTFTADLSSGPARFKDKAGRWRDVDLTLQRRVDGSVAPLAHPRGLVLSGASSGGDHDLATLGTGAARVVLGWRGILPEPQIAGSTATYPEVRPGVDLVVSALRTGFEEHLVVKNRAAVAGLASIVMPWRGNGLTPRSQPDGGLELRDTTGSVVGRVPAAQMWDASVSPRSGEHTRKAKVPMTVGKGRGSVATELTLVPDAGLLNDPTAQFPITIDPSPTFYPNGYDGLVETIYSSDQSWSSELKVGYQDDPCCTPSRARSFIRWDSSVLVGKHVLGATMYLYETWAWSCVQATWQVWITGAVSTATRWSAQPYWYTTSDGYPVVASSMTKGYDPCSADGWVTADVLPTFQFAANNGISTLTTGLRQDPAEEYNHLTWKRFRSSETAEPPQVSVTYNTMPNAPDTLKIDGKTCATGAGRPAVGTSTGQPAMQARLTDPDGTERSLAASFYLSELGQALPGTATATSSSVTSGNSATASVPTSVALLEGHVYHWAARASDGLDTSALSAECEFIVDNGGPTTAPIVSSTDYPSDGNYHGGLGVTGRFTFAANGAPDVAKYRYWWEGKPYKEVATPSLSATVTVAITPPFPDIARTLDDVTVAGPRILHVASVDPVGHVGPDTSWAILVGSAPGMTHQWRLDDPAGSTPFADSVGGASAWRFGTLTRTTGWGDGGSSYTFGSSASTATSGGVLDATKSFTVSAWAQITSKADWRALVTQDGSRVSSFWLQYRIDTDRFAFVRPNSDVDNAALTLALSGQSPQLGVWTLLTGVYDLGAQRIYLYVNGVLASSASFTSPWTAAMSMRMGLGRWNGGFANPLAGGLDDVRTWQRVLDPREIAALASAQVGRWDLDWSGVDSSGFGHDLTPAGSAGFDFVGNDPADAGSALLDGVPGSSFGTDPAAGPVVRTDQSFSVSAWVNLTATGNEAVVVAQEGVYRTGFYLEYSPTYSSWVFGTTSADSSGAVTYPAAYATMTVQPGRWYHLVGVYDANARTLKLYVDGVQAPVSATNVSLWNATGALRLGQAMNNAWLSGDIDDVRVYAGVLSSKSIAMIDDGQL